MAEDNTVQPGSPIEEPSPVETPSPVVTASPVQDASPIEETSPVEVSPITTSFPGAIPAHPVYEVLQSEGKGFGVFATRDILPGEVILSEAPLLTMTESGARADPLKAAVAALSPAKRKAYFALASHQSHPSESPDRSIMYTNGFGINPHTTAIFEIASRINHSCVENTVYEWVPDKAQAHGGRMVYTAYRKLLEGEEVTIDYGHSVKALKRIYGFECDCGGCTDSEEDDKQRDLGTPGSGSKAVKVALPGMKEINQDS